MPDKTFDLSVILKVLDKASSPLNKVGNSFKKMKQPIDNTTKSINKSSASLTNLSKKLDKTRGKLEKIGSSLSLKVTLPLTIFAGLAIRAAADFEASMNMVGAVTKATGEEFKKLEALAIELGATTQFSAAQAAEGMKFLGMASLKTDEILLAIPKTLELAASAQLDLGSAANIVTNIMAGYGMEAEKLGEVNDVLVGAFTNANLDLLQLGESFKYVGPVAKGAGLDLNTTAAVLGQLGNAGLQGSIAGTGLKNILLKLQNPTEKASDLMSRLGLNIYKSNGTLRDFVEVLEEFEKAGVTAAEASQMLGLRGGPAMAALLEVGIDKFKKLKKATEEEGISARIAAAQMKGLPGALKELKSAFEGLQIASMKSILGSFFLMLIKGLTKTLQVIQKINPFFFDFLMILGLFLGVAGPILMFLAALAIAFTYLSAASLPFIIGMGLLLGKVLLIVAAIGFLIAGIKWIIKNRSRIGNWWKRIRGKGGEESGESPVKNKDEGAGTSEKSVGGKKVVQQTEGINKSQTDINVNLHTEEGTTATVESVKTKGDSNVNTSTQGYLGGV